MMSLRSLFARCCVIRLRWLWWLAYSRTWSGSLCRGAPAGSLCRGVPAGSLCRQVTTGSSRRELCRAVFVIRVLFAFVAARVQIYLGGPEFVTTLVVSYTGSCPAAVGRDPVMPIVIEIRVVDSSLWSWHANFGGVCVASVGPLCGILKPLRYTNWEHTKGHYALMHHAAIDGLLIDVACCLWCLVFLCCAGLSDRVFRCSGVFVPVVPGNDWYLSRLYEHDHSAFVCA